MTKELFVLICASRVTKIIIFSLMKGYLLILTKSSFSEGLNCLSDGTDKGESCSLKIAFYCYLSGTVNNNLPGTKRRERASRD